MTSQSSSTPHAATMRAVADALNIALVDCDAPRAVIGRAVMRLNSEASSLERAGGGEKRSVIELTEHEITSGLDRVRYAELLIKQLPENHDGRNNWLLWYGTKEPPSPQGEGKEGGAAAGRVEPLETGLDVKAQPSQPGAPQEGTAPLSLSHGIVAYRYLYNEGPFGHVWRFDPGPVNGAYPVETQPLYAAPQDSAPSPAPEPSMDAVQRVGLTLSAPSTTGGEGLVAEVRRLAQAAYEEYARHFGLDAKWDDLRHSDAVMWLDIVRLIVPSPAPLSPEAGDVVKRWHKAQHEVERVPYTDWRDGLVAAGLDLVSLIEQQAAEIAGHKADAENYSRAYGQAMEKHGSAVAELVAAEEKLEKVGGGRGLHNVTHEGVRAAGNIGASREATLTDTRGIRSLRAKQEE